MENTYVADYSYHFSSLYVPSYVKLDKVLNVYVSDRGITAEYRVSSLSRCFLSLVQRYKHTEQLIDLSIEFRRMKSNQVVDEHCKTSLVYKQVY